MNKIVFSNQAYNRIREAGYLCIAGDVSLFDRVVVGSMRMSIQNVIDNHIQRAVRTSVSKGLNKFLKDLEGI